MISTTIKKEFFNMKMQDLSADGFFIEYKEDKLFWKKRIDSLLKEYDLRVWGFLGELPEIVFLVGNEPHRFRIADILYTDDVPEKYASAIQTKFVFAFKCVPLKSHESRITNARHLRTERVTHACGHS